VTDSRARAPGFGNYGYTFPSTLTNGSLVQEASRVRAAKALLTEARESIRGSLPTQIHNH